MRKFLVKTIVSVGLFSVFIIGYGIFCDYYFIQKRNLDLSNKKQWVLSQEGEYFDYAVLGSSRAEGAFDMIILDSLLGMKGINIASDGSGFKDNLLMLNHFLKTNSIRILFLQVDLWSLNSKESFTNDFHAFTFIPYWKDQEVQQILKEEIPAFDNQLTSLFPHWRYFKFNKYYSPKEVLRRKRLAKSNSGPIDKVKGGKRSSTKKGNVSKEEIRVSPLPNKTNSIDLYYLQKILHKANTYNVEVIFFVAPSYKTDLQYLRKVMSQFPNRIIFPDDFDHLDGVFQDQAHLSDYGRFIFTQKFSNHIHKMKNDSISQSVN